MLSSQSSDFDALPDLLGNEFYKGAKQDAFILSKAQKALATCHIAKGRSDLEKSLHVVFISLSLSLSTFSLFIPFRSLYTQPLLADYIDTTILSIYISSSQETMMSKTQPISQPVKAAPWKEN